jgi:hypothetical protein
MINNEKVVLCRSELAWLLPVVSLFFTLLALLVKPVGNFHLLPMLKVTLLLVGYSTMTSYWSRKMNNLGLGATISILIFVILGSGPFGVNYLFWPFAMYFFYQEFRYIKDWVLSGLSVKQLGIGFALLLIMVLPGFISEYALPGNYVRLVASALHIDVLYHSSVAAMLKEFATVSHGLHGLSGLEYHFGSHLLMASAAKLAGLSAFQAYSYFYVPFGPVMLCVLSLALAEQLLPSINIFDFYKRMILYIFLMIGTGVFYPGSFIARFAVWSNFYGSESFNISLIFLFTLISILLTLKRGEKMLLPAVAIFMTVILASLSKVSTGFCTLIAIGSWALLEGGWRIGREKLVQYSIFAASLLLFYLTFLLINPSMGDARIEILQFVKSYVLLDAPLWAKVTLFLLFHFIFVWLLFAAYGVSQKLREVVPLWIVLTIFLSTVVGAGVVLLLYVQGGSGAYFSIVPSVMVVPVIMLFSQIFSSEGKRWKVAAVVIAIVFAPYSIKSALRGARRFVGMIRHPVPATVLGRYVEHLKVIGQNSPKDVLVHIPRDERYWKSMDCRGLGYLIPAISERPGLYSWPSNKCYPFLCGPRFHSNGLCQKSLQLFSDQQLISEAKRLHYSKVMVVRLNGIREIKVY